jgi:hypothetical protein
MGEEIKETPQGDGGQVSEEPGQEVVEEKVETPEGEKPEAEAKGEAEAEAEPTGAPPEVKAEAAAPEPAKPDWWATKGFKSEEAALNSIDEQRAWATKTAMENAKLKVREETYRKVARGELENEEAENFIRGEEDRLESDARKKTEDDVLQRERIEAAIEVGKIKHPDIVTDANMPILDALFRSSAEATPLKALEDAVKMFKQMKGPSAEEKKRVIEAQNKMKDLADAAEAPTGRQEEIEKSVWDLTDEEFRQKTQKVRFGAP